MSERGIVRRFPSKREQRKDDEELPIGEGWMLWAMIAGIIAVVIFLIFALVRPASPKISPAPTLLQPSVRSELADQLGAVESLIEKQQFGDALRFVLALRGDYPFGAAEISPVLNEILESWAQNPKLALQLHDVPPISALAKRGDRTALLLIVREIQRSPHDTGLTRIAAESGHLPSMISLAKPSQREALDLKQQKLGIAVQLSSGIGKPKGGALETA